jgi:lipopolysaccharide/colanic/teichoic acid biosynthesis glycosyltransferase
MKDSVDKSGAPVADEFRTSGIGLFLRKVRLDELPQLWNILRGDMSFIGPRPLLFVDQPEEVSQRLAIRPGISGWAQVNGGKLITPDEKNALDLWHIGHVSFSLEMKIVWMTLLVMLRGDIRREEEISEAVNWLRQQTNSSTNNSKNGI